MPRIEWKINIGHIVTIGVLLIGFVAGYAKVQARQDELEKQFHEHQAYDDRRFETYATKDTRAARDQEVNAKFDLVLRQLDEANRRLERIESIQMGNKRQMP